RYDVFSFCFIMVSSFYNVRLVWEDTSSQQIPDDVRFWIDVFGVGLVTGIMSGLFCIGASPFIHLGLLVFLGLSVQQSVGTTLVFVLPIALLCCFGYYYV